MSPEGKERPEIREKKTPWKLQGVVKSLFVVQSSWLTAI
jgi:hypothetical protein